MLPSFKLLTGNTHVHSAQKAQQLLQKPANLFAMHLEANTRLLLVSYQLYSVDKLMLYDGRNEGKHFVPHDDLNELIMLTCFF
jgi:hypothetical protein